MTESQVAAGSFITSFAGSAVQVAIGPGSLRHLGELASRLGRTRVLLVSDPGLRKAGHVDRALEYLHGDARIVKVFDQACENPTTETVDAGRSVAKEFGPDLIVGLGGGSAMDTAKGINFLLTNGGRMADYWGRNKATRPMLPLIAIPTTAGTGSEAQSYALICDVITHEKMACGDRKALPRFAILDAELVMTQPPRVAAATGIDAVAHAVETAGSTRRNDISRQFSRRAWELLEKSFESMVTLIPSPGTPGSAAIPSPGTPGEGRVRVQSHSHRSSNPPQGAEPSPGLSASPPPGVPGEVNNAALSTIADMLLGAHFAGCAIENSMLGAAHAAANAISARLGTPHGTAVGLMLPHVIRFNVAGGENPYADLITDAEALAQRIVQMLHAAKLPTKLSEVGVEHAWLPDLAAHAATQWTGRFNPRPVSTRDFLRIYEMAWE